MHPAKHDGCMEEHRSQLRPKYSRDVSLWLLMFIGFVPWIGDSASRLYVQLYLRDIGSSSVTIGLSTSLIFLGLLLGSAAWGWLADRQNVRGLIFSIFLGTSLVVGLCAFLPTSGWMLFLVFVRAAIIAGLGPIIMALVSRRTDSTNRGRKLSYVSSARGLGNFTGSILAGFALVGLGYRGSFLLAALIPLPLLLFAIKLLKTTQRRDDSRRPSNRALRHTGLAGLYLGIVFRQMGNSGAVSLVFVYMAALAIPTQTMGILNALNPAMQIVAMLIFGRVADLVGRKRVFLSGFLLSAIALILFALSRSVLIIGTAFTLIGVAYPALFIGSTAYIGDVTPKGSHGIMLGLFESSRGLGGVAGPVLAGFLVQHVSYQSMFFCMGGLAALGYLCVAYTTSSMLRPKRYQYRVHMQNEQETRAQEEETIG